MEIHAQLSTMKLLSLEKDKPLIESSLKTLITGKTLEKTFKSGESLEAADVMELEMQYLYSDGEKWHFHGSWIF